jgi:bacterioferritin
MDARHDLIERLNKVLAWELAGVIQYLTSAALVTGPLRPVYQDLFHDGSKEARDHAEAVSERIVALGGVPRVEPAQIRQSTDLDEMIRNAHALEVAALAAWEHALEIGDAVNLGTRLWIEEMVAEEQEHVDHFTKIVAGLPAAGGARGTAAG